MLDAGGFSSPIEGVSFSSNTDFAQL